MLEVSEMESFQKDKEKPKRTFSETERENKELWGERSINIQEKGRHGERIKENKRREAFG